MARVQPERLTLSDGTPLTIRPADPRDAPATLGLFRSVLEEGRYTVQTPSEVTVKEEEEREFIEADRDDPGCLCLVAEAGGAVVGTVRAEQGRTAAPAILRTFGPCGSTPPGDAASWRGACPRL